MIHLDAVKLRNEQRDFFDFYSYKALAISKFYRFITFAFRMFESGILQHCSLKQDLGVEPSKSLVRCQRCALQMENVKSFHVKFSRKCGHQRGKNRPSRNSNTSSNCKLRKKPTGYIYTICKGCGYAASCGEIRCVFAGYDTLQLTPKTEARHSKLTLAGEPVMTSTKPAIPPRKRRRLAKADLLTPSTRIKRAKKLQQILLQEELATRTTDHTLSNFLNFLQPSC
ncbi:unnamed protein product [Enterobius vermicularis]|uniref:Nucleic acid binding protein n=1 Tax=Enterobius vermicularis TaxID=51028 RepID=A0A0N4VHD9_ENTVE|nr:unnamed protein product [Enterobius vermicularis]